MGDRLSILVPDDLHYRDAVGALIQNVCQRLERSRTEENLNFQVISAFNEAFNNLCQYASTDQPGQEIEVILEITPDNLILELRDQGKPFEFEDVESPDLLALPESGLGIFIMRSFMSEVEYTPGKDGGKNVLRMARTLSGAE